MQRSSPSAQRVASRVRLSAWRWTSLSAARSMVRPRRSRKLWAAAWGAASPRAIASTAAVRVAEGGYRIGVAPGWEGCRRIRPDSRSMYDAKGRPRTFAQAILRPGPMWHVRAGRRVSYMDRSRTGLREDRAPETKLPAG